MASNRMSIRAREGARIEMCHPADAAALMCKLCRKEQETFVVVSIDIRNGFIAATITAIGTVHGVETHPRDVFREAVRSNAAGIILGHNHPTGIITPSPEDIALTRRMIEVGKILGIPVIDHLVVARSGAFCSIREYAKSIWEN